MKALYRKLKSLGLSAYRVTLVLTPNRAKLPIGRRSIALGCNELTVNRRLKQVARQLKRKNGAR